MTDCDSCSYCMHNVIQYMLYIYKALHVVAAYYGHKIKGYPYNNTGITIMKN